MLMFQTLLKERVDMNLKVEERPLAVFSLLVAPTGSKLRRTDELATSETSGTLEIRAPAMSMGGLAARLSKRMDRPVVDKTSLEGNYEMKLTWQPDSDDGPSRDSLFRALREQLGLELKADKANGMTVYVVDKASKKTPVEN